jgi:hypothetical protein
MRNPTGTIMAGQTGAPASELVIRGGTLSADASPFLTNIRAAQLQLALTVASAIPKTRKATGETFVMSTRLAFDASAKPGLPFALGNMKIRASVSVGFGALMILGAGLAGYMLGG